MGPVSSPRHPHGRHPSHLQAVAPELPPAALQGREGKRVMGGAGQGRRLRACLRRWVGVSGGQLPRGRGAVLAGEGIKQGPPIGLPRAQTHLPPRPPSCDSCSPASPLSPSCPVPASSALPSTLLLCTSPLSFPQLSPSSLDELPQTMGTQRPVAGVSASPTQARSCFHLSPELGLEPRSSGHGHRPQHLFPTGVTPKLQRPHRTLTSRGTWSHAGHLGANPGAGAGPFPPLDLLFWESAEASSLGMFRAVPNRSGCPGGAGGGCVCGCTWLLPPSSKLPSSEGPLLPPDLGGKGGLAFSLSS